MSSGFMEIVKLLENITEGRVSCIRYKPVEKKPKKIFELLYVCEYKKLELGTKVFFSISKHVLFTENVSLVLFLVCFYETWFMRV